VMASLGNLTENNQLSVLLIDFERDTIGLHVNGFGRWADATEIESYLALGQSVPSISVQRAVTWIAIEVECAYIHCAQHIPRMIKVAKNIDWGTDSPRKKGGDYFGTVAASREV
jgi:uncharacterized protein